jgi:hypothetical protein
MGNQRCAAAGSVSARGRSLRTLAVGRWIGFAIGLSAPGAAIAMTPLPPATFDLSLGLLGVYGGVYNSPGTETDTGCRVLGSCGTSTGSLYSDISKVQSISGSTMTFQDLGAQGGVEIDYYYRFDGPAGGTVDYHLSSSGATSEYGHGDATAYLYMNGTLVNYACSASQLDYCVVSDAFQANEELSAKVGATEMIQIIMNGGTGPFGGGYSASIDPTITIDSNSVAEGYTLELSSNVTQGGSVGATAPEPSTWAMLLVGFAALGFAALRRRVSVLRNSDSAQPQAAH